MRRGSTPAWVLGMDRLLPTAPRLRGTERQRFSRRSRDLRRRRDAVRELPHEGEQALRLLKLRKMTSFWDELEASVRERLGIDTTILSVDHAITRSPRHEDRDSHVLEAVFQLRITHALSLVIDVERPEVGRAGLDLFRGHGRRIDAEGRRVGSPDRRGRPPGCGS